MITRSELEWIAGFLEGEGSFGYYKGNGLIVQANQVQLWPIERLNNSNPGFICLRPKMTRKDGVTRQACYQWCVRGPKAAGLMMTLYALMSPRRKEQIKESLSRWRVTRQGRHTKYNAHTEDDVKKTIEALK